MIRAEPLSWLLPVVCLICWAACPASGQPEPPPFDQVLPGSTVFSIVIDDVSQTRAAIAASSWGRLVASPELSGSVGALQDQVDLWGQQLSERLGVDPFEWLGSINGSVALALLDVPRELGDVQGESEFPLALALLIEPGNETFDDFADGFDRAIDAAVDEGGLVLKTETLEQLTVVSLVHPERDLVETRYAFVEGCLVLTVVSVDFGVEDRLMELVDGLRGDAEDVLADHPAFAGSLAASEPQGLGAVRAWIDLGAVIGSIAVADEARLGSESTVRELLDDYGLAGFGSLAMVSSLDEAGVHSALEIDYDGSLGVPEVLVAAIDEQRCRTLEWIPGDAASALALDLAFGSIFDASLELATSIDPTVGWEIITSLSEMEGELGFHPRDDLLENLDGQLAVFQAEVPDEERFVFVNSETPINYCLMIGLVDGQEARTLIDGQVRKHGLHTVRERIEFEGFEMYKVPVFPGVTLFYAVTDDLLVVSLAPTLVQDVLRRKGGGSELQSLANSAAFRAVRDGLPEDETVVSYTRAADAYKDVFVALQTLQQAGSDLFDGVDLPPGLGAALTNLLSGLEIPDSSVVDKYVEGAKVSVFTLHTDGLEARSSAP